MKARQQVVLAEHRDNGKKTMSAYLEPGTQCGDRDPLTNRLVAPGRPDKSELQILPLE